jgi:hypothetical protein
MLPPVTITARKLGGEPAIVEISPSETVQRLKDLLAPHFGVRPYQCKIISQSSTLESADLLVERGIVADAELSVIIMPPIPPWAEGLGLSAEHPTLLREYSAKHSLALPEWSDDEVWNALADAMKNVQDSKQRLADWNHHIILHRNGQPASLLRATPGETVKFEVKGRIWNKNGDSCIQQLLLVMDKDIVAQLSDGVPSRGRDISSSHSMKAPSEPGAYMLWRKGDLQYSMRDARRNCEAGIGGRIPVGKYPNAFVGWLVVEP